MTKDKQLIVPDLDKLKRTAARKAVAQIKAHYTVKIDGVKDAENLALAKEGCQLVVHGRTGLDRQRLKLNEPYRNEIKKNDDNYKFIIGLLAPIESDLKSKIKTIKDEKKRIHEAKVAAREAKIQERAALIMESQPEFNGVDYRLGEVVIVHAGIEKIAPTKFAKLVKLLQETRIGIDVRTELQATRSARILELSGAKQLPTIWQGFGLADMSLEDYTLIEDAEKAARDDRKQKAKEAARDKVAETEETFSRIANKPATLETHKEISRNLDTNTGEPLKAPQDGAELLGLADLFLDLSVETANLMEEFATVKIFQSTAAQEFHTLIMNQVVNLNVDLQRLAAAAKVECDTMKKEAPAV